MMAHLIQYYLRNVKNPKTKMFVGIFYRIQFPSTILEEIIRNNTEIQQCKEKSHVSFLKVLVAILNQ